MLAGFVGPAMGWRTPFIMVSIPAFLCAFLMVTTLKEPARGSQEKAVKEMTSGSKVGPSSTGEWVERENGKTISFGGW